MAMGKREGEQEDLFVTHQQLRSQSHPFYRAVNRVLGEQGFDRYVERLCSKFYARRWDGRGLLRESTSAACCSGSSRASIANEGSPGEPPRLSLRDFIGVPASKLTADHSTISRTRRLINLSTSGRVHLGLAYSTGPGS